jgi:hypothetical protein
VRWGCREHRTPRGIPCQHCADQGALFPRTAARRGRRKPPPDGPTETGR